MIMMAGMVLPILAPQASAAAEHHDWEDQHVLSINREPARAAPSAEPSEKCAASTPELLSWSALRTL